MPELSRATVLVVDDDADIRQAICDELKRGLQPEGHVLQARDGIEALEILAKVPVHLVLTDVRMPRMTGLKLLQEVRARGSKLPFVILSGFRDKEAFLEGKRLGVSDFLEKPFSLVHLRLVLTRALQGS